MSGCLACYGRTIKHVNHEQNPQFLCERVRCQIQPNLKPKEFILQKKKYCVLCLAFNAYNGLMSMFSNKATERKLHSVRQLDATSFDKLDYRRKA